MLFKEFKLLKENKRALNLTLTLKKYHSDFPPNALAIFTYISENEGISAKELTAKLGIPKATVSRNLRLLSNRQPSIKESMNLVRLESDAQDSRIKRAYLTEKGKSFQMEVIEALK